MEVTVSVDITLTMGRINHLNSKIKKIRSLLLL